MSQNTQNPYFYTLDGSLGGISLEVVGVTYISITNDATGDSVQVYNMLTNQFIDLPESCVMELSPDRGNTLATMQISPNGTNIVYVTMFGGTAQLI